MVTCTYPARIACWSTMPSPKQLCGAAGCTALITKGALHCRRHTVKTPEHQAKIAAALRGRSPTPQQRLRMSLAKRGPGELERVCVECGARFSVAKPSRQQRFCSQACGYRHRRAEGAPNWRPDMPLKTCRVCGRSFRLAAATIGDRRFTCSHTCKNVWQKSHQPNRATDIERVVSGALDELGWSYVSQAALCAVAVADFYLPDLRAAVFCDGDYWHDLPGKRERDARQTAILRAAGYAVYRFKGSDILADVGACLAAIRHP